MSLALPAAPAKAADGELTLEGIVNNTILGHAEDGYYLNLKPFAQVELPRIMLVRTADGALTLEAYGSTKGLLQNGPYGLAAHGDGEGHADPITASAELAEAIEAKEHLHSTAVRTSGEVVADLSISRHLIFGLLAMLIVLGVFIALAQRYKKDHDRPEAPKGVFQNMMEVLVVFVRDEIAKPNIPDGKWRTFLPYLLTAFFFILVANILGLVPFAGAATSNIAVTGVMAIMTFSIVLLYGSSDYYKELLTGPPDAPVLIRIILVPIEIIGLVMRHLALAIRLFANMMGGSLIIFSLIGLVFMMNVIMGEAAAWSTTVISIGFTVFILLLKLLVAFIQAYVFTILSALFIGMAVEEHHPDGEEAAEPDVGLDGRVEDRLDAVEDKMEDRVQPTTA
ncbi:F0F1 ATP synthase subunit A [Salinibacter ruber]|uniref:ATP synthase subunit a n=1 Tax=Salinibacter ruber TaxID=146919 RepID=A0A9X2ZS48_9BACT|nr:F0F1 ATP synthase subunit A [Salinibacter ruber]MCS3635517.1 F-type H+-transporting ATPase subunit a [Salinibacter ruber]MCS3657144.1 F-type H+-transporting ATPase subunit a [Salinibacter ruber]MCS3715007.1 F-type H+-transporting ATPase subunit a [Salinibacter ruber]MCS3952115.1 F-type H+-transporting ATPase subunit a [Salinibacter ruber]MCS4118565.1 F-type H+-transporting ATPase subunit a [Salinibacter ruber]